MKKMTRIFISFCCITILTITNGLAQESTKVIEVTPKVRLTEVNGGEVEGIVVMDGEAKKNQYYSTNGEDSNVSFKDGVVTIAVPSKKHSGGKKNVDILHEKDATSIGELMFEPTDKAWVLPSSDTVKKSTKNPPTGTIVFDSKRKLLCLFNGDEWVYWAAE
ncbi:MAG: hypothetical protein LBI72_14840 [Flavobacteriaceae bacterium]|jgi:hypothetical protein|nr:hypothetical protein [Flavobacteriaceae bacterium]